MVAPDEDTFGDVAADDEEVEEDDAGGRNALLDELLMILWLLLLFMLVLLLFGALEVMDILEGPHCSMARNRSRSQRRRTSSRTDRFRCGNSCTSISIALGETIEWLSAGNQTYYLICILCCFIKRGEFYDL